MGIKIYKFFIFLFSILFTLLIPKNISAETVVFFDDFNESHMESWTEVAYNGSWYLENNYYVGSASPEQIPKHRLSYSRAGNVEWSNYLLEGKIYGQNSVDKTIIPRFGSDGRLYYITFRSTYPGDGNDILLFKFSDINYASYQKIGDANINNTTNTWYSFKVEFIDTFEENNNSTEIVVSIDNQEVIRVIDKDNPILNGNFALAVWPEGPQTIKFDDIRVTLVGNNNPVNKLILAPGLGASWNTESILNCEPDNTDEGWSLAPYAEDIYNPLINSLTEAGWEVETYTYDWRRNIASHSAELESLMNNLGLETDEKVHFVGHSMGGLLGRAYLDSTSQESNKIDKYLSVGTPHKGTPLAYYPWAGAKIDTGNLLENIALNILVKHCQQLKNDKLVTLQKMIPSLQDLLPIEDYLKHYKSGQLLPVENMSLKNQWLKDTFPSYGSIIGTLSGTGQQTLEFIRYKNRNKLEEKLGYWPDGKPTGKEFTPEGDGTVTLESSQLTSAVNIEPINQAHQGLVTSSEGISNILNFFNPKLITSTLRLNTNPEPNSALVIISYPGKIWSLDPNWSSKKDKDNIISFINPKNGLYKLSIFPENNNTLLIVAQFLPNGNVLYKEYKLNGKFPKFKILNFNSSNPREDILD